MDNAIKYSAYAVVALMAAAAGWLSYRHGLDVARTLGVQKPDVYVYPAIVDGLIYMASMLLLHAARAGVPDHSRTYAWCVLGLGIAITGLVNAWAGLPHGVGGAVAYAWPAVALVLSYEALMLLIRNAGKPAETPVPGVREIMREHKVGHPKAKQIQAAMNGGSK